jgi:ATP-binding cassette subfamily B protein
MSQRDRLHENTAIFNPVTSETASQNWSDRWLIGAERPIMKLVISFNGMRGISPIVASEQKATQQLPTLQRFLHYLSPYRKELPIAIALVMLGAATQVIGPFLLGWSIDHLIAQKNLTGLLLLLGLLGLVYILGVWAIRGQIWRVGSIMQRLLARLRQDIFTKIQSLPLGFFDRSEAGDLMSRLLNDVNTVNQAFGQTIAQMLGNVFSLVGIVIAMLTI